MPATQPSTDPHALDVLCHQHHLEMRLNQGVRSEGDGTQAIAYGCTEPDCRVPSITTPLVDISC
jgi:hypothetical protein